MSYEALVIPGEANKLRSIAVGYLALIFVISGISVAAAEQGGPTVAGKQDASLPHYVPHESVSGVVKIRGSETMYPLLNRLVLEFQRRQPKMTLEVKGGGSTQAIGEFLQPPPEKIGNVILLEERTNQLKLVATSRELFDAEIKEFVAKHGYEPTAVPIAVDAVALYVHKDNPLAGLTLEQVDAMFSTTRNRGYKTSLVQWGQLGLPRGWDQADIHLYGRDRKSGTRAFFQEHCLAGGEFMSGLHEDPGAASVILDLSRDQLGIGYSGLGLQSSLVRVVPLAESEGMPFVTPSSITVADQTYPLRRALYLYIDKSPKAALSRAIQEFLAFVMSQEGQEAVAKAGFFTLPTSQVTASATALGVAPRFNPAPSQ